MKKKKPSYATLLARLEQMKFLEERYLHAGEYTYDVYGKILEGYSERYDLDEDGLKEKFKDGEMDFDFFLDDYLDGILVYLKFENEITSICLNDVLYQFVPTMIVRFVISRYYGIHIQSQDEYLDFRDKLSDKELDEFYSHLTSRGIKIDGHTLVDVEFDTY